MNDEYLQFACDLACEAGKLIRDGFDKEQAVESKPDDSPVTVVDKQINQLVIDSIEQAYPEHGLLGEEADWGTGTEAYRWICDPLDGTKPFILGVPNSVFILALMEDRELLLAVVYDPLSDRLYHAVKGRGAFCNGQPIHVSDQPLRGGYVLLGSTTYSFVPGVKAAGGRVEAVSGGGYKYMFIARGKVTALDGSPLVYDQKITGVIMSNQAAHKDLVGVATARDTA